MPTENNDRSLGYEIVVTCLYAIAIGVNVYLIANELTDGAVSASLSTRVAYWRDNVKTWAEQRRTFNRDRGRVVWTAINIVEGNESE